ncbi:uncharacterized protein [Onthophagus taurus]|uniref:uncharacterized protein n=1 Tax=Onthophagus taurus TaxID=166361 RepID=UPI000C20DF9A|nr:uncharacterized protein LOC111426876 [Onthophagus taurus]XP_022917497.1 uncharacterized protein LOC111426876 [Onthophagus taurus]XP_022917505.1 uncharacterized protein LOC111426876 [Onthophagus taurus]
MISAEVDSRLTYMTYPDPWRGTPKQQPEFLRPQPKPLALNKYNGLSASSTTSGPNGTRLIHTQQRPPTKYSPPAAAPVNLTQHQMKEEITEDLPQYSPYSRTFSTFANYSHQYHHQMYQNHHFHQPMFRPTYVQTQTIPLENYNNPTTPIATTNSGTFLSPPAAYSPPTKLQPTKLERRISQSRSPPSSTTQQQNFKVPSGKEGSLKHRLLLRPEETQKCAIDLHKSIAQEPLRKKLSATALSPPRSPASKTAFNSSSPALVNFSKGCLIQLENGDFKKLEDMKTEDFVHSAEISPELRLADSTVVKIGENPITGSVAIILTYNQRRAEAEVEYPLEHPFFVYGKGWASCNPDRTLKTYNLKVHRLQVGDVIISLTPRTSTSTMVPQSTTCAATYTTTATTTAMTVRQVQTGGNVHHLQQPKVPTNHSISHITGRPPTTAATTGVVPTSAESPDSVLLMKKRRWSAPGQIGEDDEDEGTVTASRKTVKVE